MIIITVERIRSISMFSKSDAGVVKEIGDEGRLWYLGR